MATIKKYLESDKGDSAMLNWRFAILDIAVITCLAAGYL